MNTLIMLWSDIKDVSTRNEYLDKYIHMQNRVSV